MRSESRAAIETKVAPAAKAASAAEEIRVQIFSDADIVKARLKGRELASQLGFQGTDPTLVAAAISELARNIVLYARRGEIVLKVVERSNGSSRGILVVARDDGPGIRNIEQVMQVGYSTSGSLGLGLPGAKRLMDDFHIESKPGRGTTVTMTKWKK